MQNFCPKTQNGGQAKLYDMMEKGDKMVRKPRVYYERALYHVMVRGNNKEHVFKHDEDKSEYLRRVKKYKEKYKSKLYAYVVMDNHVHLLIEVSETPLSKVMQLIQQAYIIGVNVNVDIYLKDRDSYLQNNK